MPPAYSVGIGWNVALVDLLPLVPQPATVGMAVTQRDYAGSGAVGDQGRYIKFEYSVFEDATQYQDLLAQFDILDNLSAKVTVYFQDATFRWVRRNGIAVQPRVGSDIARREYFIRDVSILVKSLRNPTA